MTGILEDQDLPDSALLHTFIDRIKPKPKKRYNLQCPFRKLYCWDDMSFISPCLSCKGEGHDGVKISKKTFLFYFEETFIPYDLTKIENHNTIRNNLTNIGIDISIFSDVYNPVNYQVQDYTFKDEVLDISTDRHGFCIWILTMLKLELLSWETVTKSAIY